MLAKLLGGGGGDAGPPWPLPLHQYADIQLYVNIVSYCATYQYCKTSVDQIIEEGGGRG